MIVCVIFISTLLQKGVFVRLWAQQVAGKTFLAAHERGQVPLYARYVVVFTLVSPLCVAIPATFTDDWQVLSFSLVHTKEFVPCSRPHLHWAQHALNILPSFLNLPLVLDLLVDFVELFHCHLQILINFFFQ